MTPSGSASLLRARGLGHESDRVGFIELFFDLVFVFAVTQLSHSLIEHFTPGGLAQTALLTVAVWWVWIYTTWVTNWLDPGRLPVRGLLMAMMGAGLVMSAAIPQAFADRGLAFAGAYAAMQVGRTAFFLWAVRGQPVHVRNFQRILAWMSLSAIFWIAGGLTEGATRIALWCMALGLELVSPMLYMWVPGLGRSSTLDWDVSPAHMAERCGLFIIIALGESILLTGATFSGQAWDGTSLAAFATAFIGTLAMWWLYFDSGSERALHRIVARGDPGRHARSVYTYLHVVIVAGVIVCAVSDEFLLKHPHGHVAPGVAAAILGGPALYLLGNALFKWLTNDRRLPPLSHLVGMALLAAAWPLHRVVEPLTLGMLATSVLVTTAVWESLALRRPERTP